MICDLYYKARGALLYNVHFKDGSLANKVTERALCGLRPVDIAWVWHLKNRRRSTPSKSRSFANSVPSIRQEPLASCYRQDNRLRGHIDLLSFEKGTLRVLGALRKVLQI